MNQKQEKDLAEKESRYEKKKDIQWHKIKLETEIKNLLWNDKESEKKFLISMSNYKLNFKYR